MPTKLSKAPTVSVIIPTLNAGSELKSLLERLWSQTHKPKEIIVVDSASTDGTAELAENSGAMVFTIEREEFDHGGTRNFAASKASGDLLVFMTQDALPSNEFMLETLIAPVIENNTVSCAYGRQLARAEANVLEKVMRLQNYPEVSFLKNQKDIQVLGIRTFMCSNVCSAIRKEIFDQLGRFPEPTIFNEDLFFAAKCVLSGYSIAYVAEAEVIHSHNYTLKQQFKRYFDNGVSMRMNPLVLPYSSVRSAGMSLLRNQIKEVIGNRSWAWFPRLIAEAGVKWVGYHFGKKYNVLPRFLLQKFSMHRRIMAKLQNHQYQSEQVKIYRG